MNFQVCQFDVPSLLSSLGSGEATYLSYSFYFFGGELSRMEERSQMGAKTEKEVWTFIISYC